jgi:hypothetical protein
MTETPVCGQSIDLTDALGRYNFKTRSSRDGYAIAVARGLRDHQKFNILIGLIEHLMGCLGWDFDAFVRLKDMPFAVDLKGCHALKHKEKLMGSLMRVPYFLGAWRHSFVNHAQVGGFEQVPTIAARTPDIVFCIGLANHAGDPYKPDKKSP